MTIADRVAHVKAAHQTRLHGCHWPGCEKQVPPAMWGCRPHWSTIPNMLRVKVWAAYEPGQELTMTPSAAYLVVAREVQQWIAQHLAKKL